nr:hypothetical protein Iba_chr07aCG13300 [Ipomoea batatas]
MTSSSKKGNLASLPLSAMHLSSRPRFLFQILCMSNFISSLNPSQLPFLNFVLCRPYPAHCSSAPEPTRRTLASDLYLIRSNLSPLLALVF